MKAAIEVSSRSEAEAIKAGLADPTTRALVLVMGALLQVPEEGRERVLDMAAGNLASARKP